MLRDITFKKSYSSANDNIVEEFYEPALTQATLYQRTTGYFNSYSLIRAAKGMASFYGNNGVCELISGLELSPEDYDALIQGTVNIESLIQEDFLDDPYKTLNAIQCDHLKLLSYLVAKGRIRIKIAAVVDQGRGIYHEKFGILRDAEGNEVSFLGSINETSAGWTSNIEQFLVFRSWVPNEKEYVEINKARFKEYWENNNSKVTIYDLPDAVRNKILKIAPNDNEIGQIINDLEKNDQKTKSGFISSRKSESRTLRDYQILAIQNWQENGNRGILAMATGSGKTFTALSAVKTITEERMLTVVCVPYGHLVSQWLSDIEKVLTGFKIVRIDSKNTNWRAELKNALFNYEQENLNRLILVGTYTSLSSESYLDIIFQYDLGEEVSLIADEVHNFGASISKKGMLDLYKNRIGLSATPARYFDEDGTAEIYSYFGNIVYEYDISQAIKDENLTPYEYYVVPAHLSEDEMSDYYDVTDKMKKVHGGSDSKTGDIFARLAIKRSRILKQAEDKILQTDTILDMISKSCKRIEHLLVYCDNLSQLSVIQKIMNEKYHLTTHKFTGEESLDDRKLILEKFDAGSYQSLLAVKCLDEGVDVPSTDKAIIVASSGNSREYIQRRGRVLRLHPGKKKAIIYDLIVLPPDRNEQSSKIVQREFVRVEDFCNTASNSSEVSLSLFGIMNEYGVYF